MFSVGRLIMPASTTKMLQVMQLIESSTKEVKTTVEPTPLVEKVAEKTTAEKTQETTEKQPQLTLSPSPSMGDMSYYLNSNKKLDNTPLK